MNKSSSLFKAAGIISLVEGIVVLIFGAWVIFPIAIGVPLIIAGNAFIKYSNMTSDQFALYRSTAFGWSIFLLFCSTISGILAFIGINQIEDVENTTANQSYTSNPPSQTDICEESKLEKIERLISLRDRNVISQEEFEHLKNKILNSN